MSNKPKATAVKGDGKPESKPKLRFPEFVGQLWRYVRLQEVTAECTARNGEDFLSESVMGVTKAEGIIPMQERLIGADISRYKLVRRNWFAYNPMRLNIGSIARWPHDYDILVSPDYVVFRCLEEPASAIDPEYLDHFRRSDQWEHFVTESGIGSVRVRIYYSDIARLQLKLPPPTEQKKIADCLTSVDELIAAQAGKLDALKTHKKGLMQQLFPREGETQPRLRFPEFRGTGEWQHSKLGDACDMQAGKFVSASEIREQKIEGLYPCFGGNGLRGYTTSFTHFGRYPLIGRQGALCGNVKLGLGQFHATEHAVVVTPENGIAVDWLFYRLEFLNLNQYATGQAQPGLSVDFLEKVPIAIPKQEIEQQRIADCLTSLEDLIAAQTQKLDALKTHKKGLMQQLFPTLEDFEP